MENVSPPAVAKMQLNANQIPPQPTTNPPTTSVANAPVQGHFYQQGYQFMGTPGKDAPPISQEMAPQHMAMGQQILHTGPILQNAQAVGNIYPHGMPMHNQNVPSTHGMLPAQAVPPHGQVMPMPPAHTQVMPPHDQIPVGLEQGQFAYSMGQPTHPPPQQQHMHSFPPSQIPPAPQWQAQQPGLAPGWMK